MKPIASVFRPLQLEQKEHDKQFHADIYYLPYPQRMRHFVLHFAKYVGRLSDTPPAQPALRQNLEQTLADTFIVALAASDVLNVDFDRALRARYPDVEGTSLNEWARRLQEGALKGDHAVTHWWLSSLAAPTGRMAKALESLDHMESFDVRDVLSAALVDIVVICIRVAAALDVDLEKVTRARWQVVASRRVL